MNQLRRIQKVFGLLLVLLLIAPAAWAQCAMCRATLESNVSDGTFLLTGENLNTGIIYLLASPYVLFAVLAILWYLNARKNSASQTRKSFS